MEGAGFVPDIEVAWTVRGPRQERDPHLEAPEGLLQIAVAHDT